LHRDPDHQLLLVTHLIPQKNSLKVVHSFELSC